MPVEIMLSSTRVQLDTLVHAILIPRKIIISRGVVSKIEMVSWDEYWKEESLAIPVVNHVHQNLFNLQQARQQFLQNERRQNRNEIVAYCHAYFYLLHKAVHLVRSSHDALLLLKKILAFEVMAVQNNGSENLAAILTHRHPGYLLSRIKYPQSQDDPKYFPLVTILDSTKDSNEDTSIFYHYRQIKLLPCSASLLCYLPNDIEKRSTGFECYHALNSAICGKIDPRADSRAQCLADLAINPFLDSISQNASCDCNTSEIQLADLGSGSGDLMRKLCVLSAQKQRSLSNGSRRRFSVTLVDTEHCKSYRHWKNREFFYSSRHFQCVRADFRKWTEKQHELGQREFHVVLMCRLLNNMSHFGVSWIDDWYQVSRLTRKKLSHQEWQDGNYLPHQCLASEPYQSRRIWITNARRALLDGHTYTSISLSDYYQGLWLLKNKVPEGLGQHPIFYYTRRFDESVLVGADGMSLLDKLCRIGMLVVIEDVDLTARILKKHLKSFHLEHLTASDLTNRRMLLASQIFCICDRKYEYALPKPRIF